MAEKSRFFVVSSLILSRLVGQIMEYEFVRNMLVYDGRLKISGENCTISFKCKMTDINWSKKTRV